MRHRGEKFVLCAVGRFGRLPRLVGGLVEQGIVHGDRGLRGQAADDPLVVLREAAGFRVSEEKSAENGAGAGDDRHGEVATYGMARRQPVVRTDLTVALVLRHIVDSDDAEPRERWIEEWHIATLPRLRERLARHPGHRVER